MKSTTKTQLKVQGILWTVCWVLPTAVAAFLWGMDGSQRVGLQTAALIDVDYTTSLVVLSVLIAIVFYVADHRDPALKPTWGEAMVGATFIFFALFWAYGVVPHQWLQWADAKLGWRPDKVMFGPGGIWGTEIWTGFDRFPIVIDKQKVRDLIAVVIYAVGLAGVMWGFPAWQKRGEPTAEVEAVSPYGRPLVRKG